MTAFGQHSRKITYGVAVSADGFIASQDRARNWLTWDPEISEVSSAYLETVDSALMGRLTFEEAATDGGPIYPQLANLVFSQSRSIVTKDPVTLVEEDAAVFVRRLKGSPGKGICVIGGGTLAGALLDAQLIDEIALNIQPVLLGKGVALAGWRAASLELLRSHRFRSGGVLNTYRVLSTNAAPSALTTANASTTA